MTDFPALFQALTDGGVEFVLIGGVAAVAHGSSRFTADLDIVYRRAPENHERLARALSPLRPALRGAPPGLPFRFDAATIRSGLNFTLETTLGSLDLLGEAAGSGTYESLLPDSEAIEWFGVPVRVVSLQRLLALKRAAGRPKDLEAIAELEAIAAEQDSADAGGVE